MHKKCGKKNHILFPDKKTFITFFQASPEGSCDTGWDLLDGQCYKVFSGTSLNHQAAYQECATTHSATLALVNSQAQYDLMATITM